jgi:hypothetical protein
MLRALELDPGPVLKLCETTFGTAKVDQIHLEKVWSRYQPALQGKLRRPVQDREILRHYQIFRLVSGLDLSRGDQVRLVLPRANEALSGTPQSWTITWHPRWPAAFV